MCQFIYHKNVSNKNLTFIRNLKNYFVCGVKLFILFHFLYRVNTSPGLSKTSHHPIAPYLTLPKNSHRFHFLISELRVESIHSKTNRCLLHLGQLTIHQHHQRLNAPTCPAQNPHHANPDIPLLLCGAPLPRHVRPGLASHKKTLGLRAPRALLLGSWCPGRLG